MTTKIGIVAGGGQFPLLFARAARQEGRQVVVVAHEGESRPDLAAAADRLYWIKLGQLGRIISYFKKEGVREAVFLGTITKTRIFRDVRPDWKGLCLWRKIDSRQDDAILRSIAAELEKEGIQVRESTLFLKKLLFPQGMLTRKQLTPAQMEDIRFGWQVARAIGAQDIGQCVVVRDRTVLAVEAIEGTDATIRRGGLLAGEKAVVVKVKKPNQDFRFDLPAIGLQTVATMREVRAAVLAVETGQALLFDGEEAVRQAEAAGIVVVGVTERADGSLSW